MKKSGIATIAMLALALLVIGCNRLTQCSLSEQDVNSYLQKQNDFKKQISIPGVVYAIIVLSDLSSQIGRVEPGKVTLSWHIKINISSLLGTQSADAVLTLKVQPVFDKTNSAIFFKEIKLVDYQVMPEKMNTVFKTLTPYLNQVLKNYFDQKPVYIFSDEHGKTEALVKKLTKGIEVKPGQIIIHLID
ncbi:MAG: lipoprotein [Candidatus Malihini olakiniferum]